MNMFITGFYGHPVVTAYLKSFMQFILNNTHMIKSTVNVTFRISLKRQ